MSRITPDLTVATDASTRGGGVVFANHAFVQVRADSDNRGSIVDNDFARSEVKDFTLGHKWRRAIQHRWRFKAPIAQLEYHALLLGLRWASRRPSLHGTRLQVSSITKRFASVSEKGAAPRSRVCLFSGGLPPVYWSVIFASVISTLLLPTIPLTPPLVCDDGMLLSLATSTRRNYARGLCSFLTWARAENKQLSGGTAIDLALSSFIQNLFTSQPTRGNFRISVDARAAVFFFHPELQGSLPRSLQATKGFKRAVTAKQTHPVPFIVMKAIAGYLF